jgi:hypothetical protein
VIGQQIDLANPLTDHPLNRGLVAAWCPVQGQGTGVTIFDLVGRKGKQLSRANGPTLTATPGGLAAAVYDRGSSQRADLSGFSMPTAAGTVVVEFRPDEDATSAVNGGQIFGFRNSSPLQLFDISVSTSTVAYWYVGWYNNSTDTRVGGASGSPVPYGLTTGKWTTVSVSWNGSATSLCLGGRFVDGLIAAPQVWDTSGVIGRVAYNDYPGQNQYWSITVGGIRVFDRALQFDEISFLNDSFFRGHPDLIRRWSRKTWLFGATTGGSPQTATPSVASVGVTGVNPATIQGGVTATPSVGLVTVTGVNPVTVQGGVTATAGVGSVTVSGVDPARVKSPTLTSVTINSAGTQVSFTFDEAVTGTSGFGQLSSQIGASAASLSYSSGSGTSTLVYNLSRPSTGTPKVYSADVYRASYTPGTVESVASGYDVAAISNFTVTNNSTQGAPGIDVSSGVVDVSATGILMTPTTEIATTGLSTTSAWTIVTDHGSFSPDSVVRSGLLSVAFDWYDSSKWVLSGETVNLQYTPGSVRNVWGTTMGSQNVGMDNPSNLTRADVASATVNAAGDTLTVQWNLPGGSTSGVEGSGSGFSLNSSGAGVSISYSSGSGTNIWEFSVSGGPVAFGDVLTLDYSGGDATLHVTELSGAPIDVLVPVLDFSGFSATNDVPPPSQTGTPTVATVSVSGVNPATIQGGVVGAPSVGLVTVTGVNPSSGSGTVAVAGIGSVAITGVDPVTIQGGITSVPSVGLVSVTGVNPATLQGGITVTPGTGLVQVAGVNPVTIQGGVVSTPGLATVVVSGIDPLASVTGYSTPGTAVVAVSGVNPATAGTFTTASGVALVTVSGVNPATIQGGVVGAPSVGLVTVTGVNPVTLQGPVTAVPGLGSVSVLGVNPATVQGPVFSTPGTGLVTVSGVNPTAGVGAAVGTPSVAVVTVSGANPATVQGGVTVTPGTCLVVAAGVNPAANVTYVAVPGSAGVGVSASAPTWTTGGAMAVPGVGVVTVLSVNVAASGGFGYSGGPVSVSFSFVPAVQASLSIVPGTSSLV